MALFQNQSSLVWLAFLVYLITDIHTDYWQTQIYCNIYWAEFEVTYNVVRWLFIRHVTVAI